MLRNKRILLTILMVVLLLLIPNIVKAGGEFVDRVDITGTIPTECILGEKATVPDDISVKINGTEVMEIRMVSWVFNGGGYGGPIDTENYFIDKDEEGHPVNFYALQINFKRPKSFEYTENTKVYVNGVLTEIDIYPGSRLENEFYTDWIDFNVGKAKARINFDPEDIVVLDPEVGEITTALPGTEIRLLAYGENSIDATGWKVTVTGKSGAVEVTEHDEYVSEEDPFPYYTFTMPAEDVTITAEYIKEVEEAKEEAKEEKDKTPKTGLAGNKTSFVGIGIAGLVLTLGAVTIIKKK